MKRTRASKQRMLAHLWRRAAANVHFEVGWNRPVLRVCAGGSTFIPASGPCPWQIKRMVAKVTMNSSFGKFASAPQFAVSLVPGEIVDIGNKRFWSYDFAPIKDDDEGEDANRFSSK